MGTDGERKKRGIRCERGKVRRKKRRNKYFYWREASVSHRKNERHPLQYPLIFPDGQDGWHTELQHTALQHVNYMLMEREGVINPILRGNGLGQQYMVDQWCKVELDRLRWCENNQKTLRAELYSGLQDATKKDGTATAMKNTGKRVILPSTFMGGERYMHQQLLDTLALYQRFGHPHFFITMTCNPDWAEIKQCLKPGQTALDRPDLVSRVFKLKKQELMRDLASNHIFGKAIARTHTIEFQKRGFPHAHIIVWLEPKIGNHMHMEPHLLDSIICAEIPDEYLDCFDDDGNPLKNPIYQDMVKFMLHRPCGPAHPERACMKGGDGFCRFNFPKDYISVTQMSDNGYPLYRRRSPEEGGNIHETFRNNERIVFTNADVVPYSKYLLNKFHCHINVEYCHSIQAVKYLFKYMNKGPDQATVVVENESGPTAEGADQEDQVPRNEVLEYQTKRYTAGAEATWRLRGNELARDPAVYRLSVHLPDQQTVYYDPNNYDESIERMEKSKRTKLTAYFDLNSRDPDAHQHYYREIPEFYRWDQPTRTWVKRKRQPTDVPETIGRMYQIHPTQLELYSLRLLLNNVKGATSFDDLKRKIDGESGTYETFHAAAIARHLVKNDKIWIDCMNEASETETNIHRLRKLFVTILINCEVKNPCDLYQKCDQHLKQDYAYQYKKLFKSHLELVELIRSKHATDSNIDTINGEQYNEDGTIEHILDNYALNSCLYDLQRLLSEQGHSLTTFNLPQPDLEREQFIRNCLVHRHITEDNNELSKEVASKFFHENFPLLNPDQRHAFDTIKQLIIDKNTDGILVFLDAPGGTGKTFTLNVLISWICMQDEQVASSATSGIAATLLHLGRTSHNMFKFPIPATEDSICNISKQSELAKFLLNMVLGIIDEGPMLDRLCYETLDRTLKDFAEMQHKGKKFGGKVILVSGDFRQLLPVIPKGNRAKIVYHTLKSSTKLWDNDIVYLKLTENMRIRKEINNHPNNVSFHQQLKDHEQWLLDLGEGKLPSYLSNIVEIPPFMCAQTQDDVFDTVFGDMDENIGNAQYFKSRAILAATNDVVNATNNNLVDCLPGELRQYHSVDTVGDDDDTTIFPTEFLNSLSLSGMADHELNLKVNTPVILLRNLDLKGGHCNGTRYLIKALGDYTLILTKMDAKPDDKNNTLILPRIPMKSNDNGLIPFELRRLQFPIKPAFALTINRAQGQSLETCGILLPTSVWTHGQIYVAFSRCGNPNKIIVWADQQEFEQLKLPPDKTYTRNVVYQEVI